MVLLHIKGSDSADEFILEQQCSGPIDVVSQKVINIWNLRLRIRTVAETCKQIAHLGTLRPELERGITDPDLFKESFPESETNVLADPDGQRMGNRKGQAIQLTSSCAITETFAFYFFHERRLKLQHKL